jgi:hypothetical protein
VTDGAAGSHNEPANKTWVDAYITIDPPVDTNMVGDTHTFYATVMINDGSILDYAPDGTIVDFKIVSGPGTLSATSGTVSGGTGQATVDLTSYTAGTTVVSASIIDLNVNGVLISRSTDGNTPNSGPATKYWIAPEIETACAAHIPGDYRFTEKGNWFTYVDYARVETPDEELGESTTPGVVNIYASKDTYIGYVEFVELDLETVRLTIHLDSGWYLADDNSISVQDYPAAPDGVTKGQRAVPGSFDYQYAEGDTIDVLMNNFYCIHIDVYSMP